MRLVTLLLALVLGAGLAVPASARADELAPAAKDDADVVVVLPTRDADVAADLTTRIAPYLDRQRARRPGLRVTVVSLGSLGVATDADAEAVRQALRATFTDRATTPSAPRVLALVGVPDADYVDPGTPLTLDLLPRFRVTVRNLRPLVGEPTFWSDAPFGFLRPDTVDGSDGFVDPADLDMRQATFSVFRMPVGTPADLSSLVTKSATYASASYRSDVAQVAGTFQYFPGDSAVIQCIESFFLMFTFKVGQLHSVYDAWICNPEFLMSAQHRAAEYFASTTNAFRGGVIYDISHGSPTGIYAGAGSSSFQTLGANDIANVPANELSVFLSLSCSNDGETAGANFAYRWLRNSGVTFVSGTSIVSPANAEFVWDAEIAALPDWFRGGQPLAWQFQDLKTRVYSSHVLGGDPVTRPEIWKNLLTVSTLGDGFVVVSK